MKRVSIIIPAFNEERSISLLTEKILKSISKIHDYNFEIIFVDDGSTDTTLAEIRKVIKKSKPQMSKIIGISLSRNYGKTAALDEGIQRSIGDFLIFMDADLQDDPSEIRNFLRVAETNKAGVVVGNRVNRYKRSLIKKVSSTLANTLIRATANVNIHDINCGFKLLSRDAAKSLTLKSDYHRFIPILCSANGFHVVELEIRQHRRKYGESKYGTSGLVRVTKTLLDATSVIFIFKFKDEPFSFFGKAGGLILVSGMIILLYLTIEWFLGRYIESRPLFFLGILSVITGINLISLGFLGELIGLKRGSGYIRSKQVYE
jgi:glycosyltransferase involved in cell wall biosynthesis